MSAPGPNSRDANGRGWTRAAIVPGGIALAVIVGALAASPLRPHSQGSPPPSVDRVVVVAVPRLVVSDLGTGRVPTLDRLARDGAVAAVATRGLSARPSVSEAYLSLSAGSRVKAEVNTDASATVAPGVPTRPGTLGSALHEAGVRTAVIGASTPAVAALADRNGRVDAEVATADFVVSEDGRTRSDPARVVRLLRAEWGRVVALLDTGDTTRAGVRSEARRIARGDPEQDLDESEQLRRVGLSDFDRTLAAVADEVERTPDTLLVVVGLTPTRATAELSPLVMHGAGIRSGIASSPATNRPGLVTLTDLAPTILGAVGGRSPDAMTGREVLLDGGDGLSVVDRIDRVARSTTEAYVPSVTSLFVVQSMVLVAAAVWLVATRRRPGWAPRWWGLGLAGALLSVTAWPAATFLAGLRPSGLPSAPVVVVVTWLIAVALGVGALVLGRRGPPERALLLVAAVSTGVIALDIVAGSRLQGSTVLGHTPLAASRFHGVGNAAYGAFAAAALMTAALIVATGRDRRRDVAIAASLLGVVFVLDAAPGLGADFGGVLSLVPAGLLLLALVVGRRIEPRFVGLALLFVAVAVVAVVGADLLRPADSRTHIGDFASDVFRDPGQLWTTISRKWSVNMASLRRTTWTRTLPAIVLALVAASCARRRRDAFRRTSPTGPAVIAVAVLAVIGFLTNDSGLLVLGVAVVWLAPLVILPALAADTGVLASTGASGLRPVEGPSVESSPDGRPGLRAPRSRGCAPRLPVEPATAGVVDGRPARRGRGDRPTAG